jgi:TatD DNase family protein
MIDTHAHLNFSDYQKDLDKIIKRALVAGVNQIICVSSSIKDSQKAVEIAQKYPGIVYAAVGIHPQQTDPENTDPPEKQLKKLAALAKSNPVVAIGECGLDFSPPPPGEKERSPEEQFFLLEGQVKIAQKLNLPLIIHSRKAFVETKDVLSRCIDTSRQKLRGVFHCYSGGKKRIKEVLSLNFYFGVDGNLTYDSGLQNVFAQIPLEKILLETDAPFLSPIPKRGQRNEPAFLKHTAEKLAEIKGLSPNDIDQKTTENAKKLFAI